ncbi:SNF2 family N-terminal domain-containing protein [Sporodiniella umbellata]|nr:SNF2 family N-terminal domain-containing protein [Sporodiniella umbellata]
MNHQQQDAFFSQDEILQNFLSNNSNSATGSNINGDYIGNNANAASLYIDTQLTNNGYYDNSPQYPTHFMAQQQQQQQQGFIGLLNNGPTHQFPPQQAGYDQRMDPYYRQYMIEQKKQQELLLLERQQQLQHQHSQYQHHHQQQYHPPQHQQTIYFQHKPTSNTPTAASKRTSHRKKKPIKYGGDWSDEEEEEEDIPEEEEEDGDQDDNDEDSDYASSGVRSAQKQAAEAPAVMIPMGTKTFERILDYKLNENTQKHELLVKYKFSSYHHAEWVPQETIEGEHLGKHRVKKFLTKWYQEGQKGEDFSEYLKVDRVIDEGELRDAVTGEPKLYYLVKWKGLFYDASTWESEQDVQKMDETKIQEYQQNRMIPQEKLTGSPKKPDYSQFIKYGSGMKYKFNNELRSYQLEGLNWLRFCYYHNRSCILADEMGLGKTVQSVAFLNDVYYHLNIKGPFLIVAPLSTIPHWERAIKAWTDLNVVDYRGSALSRSLLVETEFYYKDQASSLIAYKFDVLITTYEMASSGVAQLKDIPWKCAIFDEAHRLKNKQSKVGEILKTFSIEHKVLLTGTPLQNNLDELYSLLNFMQPDIFNDEKTFFIDYGKLQTAAEVEKLQALLKPIMLRRFKEDVEKTIPVKEETVIEVELTNPQKKWYRAILEKNFSFLRKGAKSNKEMPQLRNIVMQLRKCCIHPYLLEGAEEVITRDSRAVTIVEQFNCLVQSSGKLVLIDKLLRKLFEGNHKVLIFSQFTSCLDILSDYLRGRQYPHERIDGSVPSEQRQASIDRFSTMPITESFVFLLCTRAGGVGINLTAADTCIIFDSDWNPQNDLQAQARCHRIGQTKPVQVYRLICRNTYEKDMFDRAGMKLGLDKAVMQRMNSTKEEALSVSKNELNRKEIEDLLKKGAYGAVMDDEESAQFCEEDIDQILERRTTVIRHEGNEKGSIFSKATFNASAEQGVELDDPDFWEKWAAKANLDVVEAQDENELIVYEPRRRRQVQRFGTRQDGVYSDEDNAADSDAYEDESEKSRKRDIVRPWTLSEKTKYERKLMIYGYGPWKQMQSHFPRRSEKDLKAATRNLMRQVRPQVEGTTEEDKRLIVDIDLILENDAEDEVSGDLTVPYKGASKKQMTEYKSFLIQAPTEYIEHIERKGRNFLLRIQMLHMVRDRIVPKDWDEAKKLPIPKVNGSLPCDWWGESEDRDLLLGICKHGYQQYLTMRKDKEFCFYGKRYDDSKAGTLQEDDDDTLTADKQEDSFDVHSDDTTVYVWPSKADIGMRLRRIIAAFLREQGIESKKRRSGPSSGNGRSTRQRGDASNRWQKKSRSDFLRTILSFGVETVHGDPNIRWDRFRELSGLDKKNDAALDVYYYKFISACKEIMKRQQKPTADDEEHSRESSEEPSSATAEETDQLVETIPYDKARRALKRVDQMKRIREHVVVAPDLDAALLRARKTSGLPVWWEVPLHDKALLQGICKNGIGRHDLMITDTELPFYKIVNLPPENGEITNTESETTSEALNRIAWPKDLVIARRIESLCELILRPRPPPKRSAASRNRKPKPSEANPNTAGPNGSSSSSSSSASNPSASYHGHETHGITASPAFLARRKLLSDVETDSEDEDDDEDDEEQGEKSPKRPRYEPTQTRLPTKPLKSQQTFRYGQQSLPSFNNRPHTNLLYTKPAEPSTSAVSATVNEDDEMEDGEIGSSDEEEVGTHPMGMHSHTNYY